MNAPHPMHATSPAQQSALPEAWIDRLFGQFEALYGSKFADLWRGTNVERVKATWAEKLGGFADQPKAIKAALDACDERPFPPTLPEFLTLCRDAGRRIRDDKPALPYKPTPEEESKAKDAARKAIAALTNKVKNGIDEHWATHPRSHAHLKMIFDAAGNDARFRPCIANMVSAGICTENGRLLKLYRNGDWERV